MKDFFAELGGGLVHVFTGTMNVIGTLTRTQKPPRPLTERERELLGPVYGPGLDLDKVRIVRGGPNTISLPGEPRIPRGVGNTIYWPTEGPYARLMDDNGITNDAYGEKIFVHEAAHVAQFQNAGRSGAWSSLTAQAGAILSTGNRNGAYEWKEPAKNGVPWSELNAEQQAHLVEQAFEARVDRGGRIADGGVDLTDYVKNALAEVRAGRGWA